MKSSEQSKIDKATKLAFSQTPTYDQMDTFLARPSIAIRPVDAPHGMDEIIVKRPTDPSVKASYELCKSICTSQGSCVLVSKTGELSSGVRSVLSAWNNNRDSESILSGVTAVVDATNAETRRKAAAGIMEADLPVMYVVTASQIDTLAWFAGQARSERRSRDKGLFKAKKRGSRVIHEFLDCSVENTLRLHPEA